jgi:hypothetical protein
MDPIRGCTSTTPQLAMGVNARCRPSGSFAAFP